MKLFGFMFHEIVYKDTSATDNHHHLDSNMSKQLEANKEFLSLFRRTHPSQRRVLVDSASGDQLDALCACVYNILVGNVPISDRDKKKLKKYKKQLCILASRKSSRKYKKSVLQQRGGFLGALAGTLIPTILGTILGLRK
jgi:hypothetical protein